jgi:hypothetical protein
MAANSTSYAIRLRAVNGVGNGVAGNSESATSGTAAPSFTDPTDLTELFMWLDFTDTANLYTDSPGTTNVSTNGDDVERIEDKSSNGWVFSRTSTDNTWDATNGQVTLGGTAISIYDSPDAIAASAPTSGDIYFTIKSSDTQFLLLASQDDADDFAGVAQTGATSPNSANVGDQVYVIDGGVESARLATRTAFLAAAATGSGVVVKMTNVDLSQIGDPWRLFGYKSGGFEMSGAVTHYVAVDTGLSASDRTALETWLVSEVPA